MDFSVNDAVFCFSNHHVGTVNRIAKIRNRYIYVVRFSDGTELNCHRDDIDPVA